MTSKLVDDKGRHLTIRRGTSPSHTFAITVEGTTEPKNLMGAIEVTFAIASSREAAARDLMLTLDNGVSHNGTGGVVTVSFTKDQTEGLAARKMGWAELWITDAAGRRDLVAEGRCEVLDTLITL